MVLTEEQNTDIYPAATLETSKIATEENYYNITTGQVVDKSQAIGIPDYANNNGIPNPPANPSFDDANSAKLYVLNKNSQETGLGITLKVMAGDKLDIFGKSYYFQNNTGGTGANAAVPIIDILTGFLGGPSGSGIAGAHGATATQLDGITATTDPISSLLTDQTTTNNLTPQKPKAFINYLLFDEQFRCVGKGFAPVGDNSVLMDYAGVGALHNISVTKNGYVYIYCSNESPVDVFFDNLQVVQTKGPILEETHYYPFRLTMAGISDRAAGGLENRYKYNGIEFDTSLGLNEYEAELRDLDPQDGRWWQIDPETENQEMWSPYASNYDNPILYKDPRGNEGEECCEWLKDIATTVVATTAVTIDNAFGSNVTGTIANSGAIPSSQTATWNNAVTTANQTSVVAGVATAVVGGGVATGGEGATVVTGGLSSEVTAPVAAVGLGMAAAGTWVAANATKNLQKGNGLINNNNSSSGRGSNNRKPDKEATGDHSVIDKNGNTTYKQNKQNPSGFDEVKRTDIKGKAHTNRNGTKVETPHVHEKAQKDVRPAVKGQDY